MHIWSRTVDFDVAKVATPGVCGSGELSGAASERCSTNRKEGEFDGSVMSLIDEGISYLLAKINMGCYFKGAFRHDRHELPPNEMRELVINAFAHRSYLEHGAQVFLAIYDNREEITSPGGLPHGQTADRMRIRGRALRADARSCQGAE